MDEIVVVTHAKSRVVVGGGGGVGGVKIEGRLKVGRQGAIREMKSQLQCGETYIK